MERNESRGAKLGSRLEHGFKASWRQLLPVEHHLDAAGNSWATLRGESERVLILGSHLDSVPNGGWLDGCLGVLASFEVLRSLAEDFHGRPPVTIRLVDWADEEGARFGRSLFGSSAFAGTHTIQADRGRTDRDGIRLEDALRKCHVDVERIGDAGSERAHNSWRLPGSWGLKQGPVLKATQLALWRGGRGRKAWNATRITFLFYGRGGAFRVHSDGRALGCLAAAASLAPGRFDLLRGTIWTRWLRIGSCSDFSGASWTAVAGCGERLSQHGRSGRGRAGFDVAGGAGCQRALRRGRRLHSGSG